MVVSCRYATNLLKTIFSQDWQAMCNSTRNVTGSHEITTTNVLPVAYSFTKNKKYIVCLKILHVQVTCQKKIISFIYLQDISLLRLEFHDDGHSIHDSAHLLNASYPYTVPIFSMYTQIKTADT
jgi:hypothetical protein